MRLAHAALLASLACAAAPAGAGDRDFVVPTPADKCHVCGMFVARYPDWVAGVRFGDGGHAVFDGAKDLFKFLFAVERYAPKRTRADVRDVFVTDYYGVRQIDARAAWFVIGSDVLGPMGNELVPFAAEADAREFLKDHRGRRLLRFDDVTPALVKELG